MTCVWWDVKSYSINQSMTLHYYEDEAVRRRRPAGRCMLT